MITSLLLHYIPKRTLLPNEYILMFFQKKKKKKIMFHIFFKQKTKNKIVGKSHVHT